MCSNFIDQLDRLWERLDREAEEDKYSQQAVMKLAQLYQEWDSEPRRIARRAFRKWLNSSNPAKRFDALALIREFDVVEATDELLELKAWLEQQSGPQVAFELRKVEATLGGLGRKNKS